MQNLIQIPKDDRIRSVLNVRGLKDPDYLENTYLIFCTEQGTVKKTPLEAYSRPRTAGINAITINEGDRLLDVAAAHAQRRGGAGRSQWAHGALQPSATPAPWAGPPPGCAASASKTCPATAWWAWSAWPTRPRSCSW